MNRKGIPKDQTKQNRRTFIKSAGAATLLAPALPLILTAAKTEPKSVVIGEGEHQYEAIHNWGELPDHVRWGDTHGVCVDAEGMIYVAHRSKEKDPIDSIVVFDPHGRFVRSFGAAYHTGGHGIDVRHEGNEEFLYLSCIRLGFIVKATLTGEEVLRMETPQEPGVYDDPKAKYAPTNIAFGPDGGFYVGDGYGSNYIHQYDKDANWVRTWGGTGAEPGKMKTPHGLWLDARPGREPSLAVCDRANARLQYFALNGEHLGFVNELSFPADLDIQGEVLLCPDLHARITMFDKDNKVITHLGHDADWTKAVLADNFKMRQEPKRWENGRFIHPHDACFDADGNIFVAEWVPTGRISKLRRVS